jgi:cytidine deaminase
LIGAGSPWTTMVVSKATTLRLSLMAVETSSLTTTEVWRKLFTQCEVYCLEVSSPVEIPWLELRERAILATSRSYAPYSHVSVGASAITADGRFVDGSNVENASYGLTLCAECSLVSDLARQGGGRLTAVSIVAGDGKPIAPCGRCRQVLFEHGGNELLVDGGDHAAPTTLGALLPDAFGPDDLGVRKNS